MIKRIYTFNKSTDEAAAAVSSAANSEGSFDWASLLGADGEGPYAFKTLWKEITKAVGYVMTGIMNLGITRNTNSAEIAKTYWEHAHDRADNRDSNLGFYLILGLVLVAGLIVFIVNNKNSN